MIIFSQEILTIFGREFATGATTLVILSVGQLMYSATGPLGVMINMSGRSKLTLLNTVLHLLLQVGLCVVLIPQYGIIGAAVANTISKGVQRAIQLGQVRLILRMHPFRTEYLKPVAAGVASWLVLSLFKAYFPQNNDSVLFPILGSLIFLVIYGSMLYRLGFDEEDEMILQRLRSKLLV
jgi:O-antigen/teichoic acid export membrane protein